VEPDHYVFAYPSGKPRKFTWWKKHFEAAMIRANLMWKEEGKIVNPRRLEPHSFRHYAERRIMPNGFEKSLPGRELALPDSA
jgi:hypothetical protein